MAGQFKLIAQLPKPRKPIIGVFTIDRHGDANFFSGDGGKESKLVAALTRARVDSASSSGIMVSGYESNGVTTRYQEWWMIYA